MDNNLQNSTVVQPSANPAIDVSSSSPTNADAASPAVKDLGVNEAVNIASFPTIGNGTDASLTIEQPAGGPIVDGQAGPN
jgi:hypothetical protein